MDCIVHLQGYIQDAYIVSGPNGYLKQCPNIETQCPTCGQYSNLLKTLDDLLKKVDDLTQRVSRIHFYHQIMHHTKRVDSIRQIKLRMQMKVNREEDPLPISIYESNPLNYFY